MSDTAIIITEAIKMLGAIAAIILPLVLSRKLTGIHKQINSRMDQALITKQELGKMQGRQELTDETADKKPTK